jgi:large subunit ribosomal protein L22
MEVIAKSVFIRQTPRKLLLVADQIRGLMAQEAMVILKNLDKQAAEPLLLTLRQGVGNAVNNFHLDPESLKIKKLEVNRGPTGKRWRFVARGRVHQVQKKSSHIKIVLEGEERKLKLKTKNKKPKTQT